MTLGKIQSTYSGARSLSMKNERQMESKFKLVSVTARQKCNSIPPLQPFRLDADVPLFSGEYVPLWNLLKKKKRVSKSLFHLFSSKISYSGCLFPKCSSDLLWLLFQLSISLLVRYTQKKRRVSSELGVFSPLLERPRVTTDPNDKVDKRRETFDRAPNNTKSRKERRWLWMTGREGRIFLSLPFSPSYRIHNVCAAPIEKEKFRKLSQLSHLTDD